MKKNSMRFLSFLLATIMVVSLFPMGIFAENSSNDAGIVVENSGASDSKAETNKPTVTEGMDFTASDAAASGEGWAWDNATKTLTLNGVSVQTNIVLPDGSTIHVEDGTESDVAVASGNAIYVDGTLTINGAGKLSVESGFDTKDARAIRATASISVENTELSAKAECAVAAPSVSITDSKVDLYGYYYGIHAKTTAGEADSTVVLRNVSGKIAGYGYGGINAHSETANVYVELDGCHDLEIYNEVNNDSTGVNFNFAGIRAYTRGSGKDATVNIAYCEDVTIQNSTMAILAANNANAADPEVAESSVYIKESEGIKLVGNTSCYSAVFVNNYGIENNDSAVLSIAYSEVEVLAPNATALMTSTKSAPSEVEVADSDVTITAGLTGIRTIASGAEYADTDVTGSTVTFVLPAGHNAVDESVGTVVADEAFADEASTIIVKKPAVTYEVATKAELVDAIAKAADGDTVKLTADIESDAVIVITKAITLDLGGYKLTTTNGWGGLQLKNGCSVKNGTLLHTGRVNAIRAWDVVSLEDLVIEVTDTTEGKTVGGISIQENAAGIDTIKNVTLKGVGLDYGIETYNCGNAQVIGTMENVNIDAVGTGMVISAPCGTATNCTIKGGVSGIDMLLKGTYSVSIDLVNCTVEGGEQAVYAHDEQMGYTYVGSIQLTADEETDFVNANGVYLKEEIASTTSADLDDVRNYKVTFIGSIDELLAFAQAANAGNTFKGETVKLTADLDFNGGNWLEIDENGTVVTDFRIPNFAGTFDGQDHVIKNFNYVVSQSGNHRAMMFSGTLTGVVKNLEVEGVTATIAGGATRVAAVANTINANSATNARLDNVHVKNFTVNCDNLTTDQTWFGALSVYTNGGNLAIKDCSVTDFTLNANSVYMGSAVSSCITPNNDFVNVTVTNFTANIDTVSGVFGGFAGQTQSGGTNASFTDCHVIGLDVNIKEITGDNVGGFMSTIGAATQFYNCSTQGTIDVTEDTLTTISVGGFIGDHGWNGMYGADRQHEFKNCVADVDITAVSANVGGFVGNSTIAGHPERHIPAYFVGCEAKGDVKTTNGAAGGFVGQGDRGLFTDCSASGNVTGNIAGGFWGYIYPKTKAEAMGSTHQDPLSKSILLDGCVATGTVEGTAYEAGLIGFMKDVYVDANNELGYATPVILSGNTPSDYNRFDYSAYGETPDITVYVATVNGQGYKTLAEAIAAANAIEGGATVTLLADVTLGEKLTITGNVTIEGAHTITRDDAYTGTLFAVNAGATLTLDGGLTIDGGNNWAYTVFPPVMDLENGSGTKVADHITPAEGGVDATAHMIVNNGTLNVHSVTIENSYSTGGFSIINAGVSSVTTLNGATIRHNAANRSGAIAYIGGNDAVLTIKGTTRITDNFGIGNGGIIQNYGQGTTVNFEGGSIDNNFVGSSGTLYASYSGNANKINTFNMTGGIITKNVMEGYGPVYIHTNTVWNMTGGEISENISFLPSYVRNNNPAGTMTGGKIVNNEITGLDYSNGYYVTHPDLRLNGKTAITGGTYTQDVSEYLAPNTGLEYVNGQYTVIDKGLFKLHLTDPNTGEPATIPYLEGNDLAALVAYGKSFYANYYKMTLEVLYDVKIDKTVVIDYPMTIDLNGHTLTADTSMDSTPVFRVVADVTVTGEGKIDGRPGTSSYAFIVGQGENAGNLTIENGTFYGSVTAVSVTKGTATINGGNFAADPYVVDGEDNYNFLLNCIDANYKDGTAKIIVKGGTFYKFNPADNAAEGEGTSFVHENYLAEADGDYYTVRVNKDTLPKVADVVITLKGGQTITLTYPSERFDTIQKLIGTNDYADFVVGAEQSELLAYAANGEVTEIVMNLYDDIALDAPINFYNKYFQVPATYDITINGNNNTITWADGYNGTLINVESGVGVTLNKLNIFGENTFSFYDDTTTVEDGQNWYTRFVDVGEEDKAINANVIVNAGDLTLNSVTIAGVTIASDGSNGKTANTETGGFYLMYNDDLAIIKSNGGTVALNDSRIDNNAGLILNAINAKTEINGTGITNNMGAGNKGGIIIANGGTMSIKDATINNNKAMARSATILGVINGAVVSFNGFSTMDYNKHIGVGSNTAGAMIVLEGASQFVMNGGSISNNIGGRAGAIASRWSTADAMIELVSGTIKGNSASNDSWNGASVFLRSPATIGAGMKVDGIIAVNQAPGELDITGGTFTNFELIVADGLSAEITGGTFDNDPSEWLADGYVAPKNDDGSYTARAQYYVEWVKEQLLAGNDVTLTEDIVITDYDLVNAIPLPSNGNGRYNEAHGNGAVFHITKPGVELDLNGHSITWDAHDDAYCNKRQVSLFMVTATGVAGETADFTITDSVGTGKVDVYGMGSGVYVVLKTAKATVKGGTWTNYPCNTCGASNIFMYPSHGGTLEITGGTFEQKNGEYLLGCYGSTKETNDNGVGVDYDSTQIIISGGTFVGFNPENVKFIDIANGGAESEINGCKLGYMAKDNGDGTFTVKPNMIFELHLTDANGDAHWLSPMSSNDLASIVAKGKIWYESLQGTYDFTLKIKGDWAVDSTVIVDFPLTIDLGGYTVTGMNIYPVIRVQEGATVTVTGNGSIVNATDYVFVLGSSDQTSAGYLTIENGTFVGQTTVASVTKGILSVNGGTFKCTASEYGSAYMFNCVDANYKNGTAQIVVKGGTFVGFDPMNNAAEGAGTNFCSDGHIAEELTEGYFTVRKANYVAEVNGVKYESLQDAINACTNGETVKLIADIIYTNEDIRNAVGGATGFGKYPNPCIIDIGGKAGENGAANVPSSVNAILDLNGHTITSTADAYLFMIMDNAKLTFTDSSDAQTGKVITTADAPVIWVIGTETLVTVEGGFYQTASATGLIHVTHGGDLVVNGGEFKTTADDASLLIMLNTKDRQNAKFFISGNATVTIKGGTFHGFNPAKVGDDNGATSIEDIKFVNGCAEGFAPKANADGSYGVVKALAEVNGEYYASLAEALAAAQNGDEIVILQAGTYKVPTGKNITITGAVDGVEFDMSKAVGVNASMTFNNVTFNYGNSNYKGLQHAGTMVYNNCTINGQVFLYGASETFNGCTFNQTSAGAYNVWTYGAKEVAFNNCTFNSAGKAVLIYAESASITNDVTFTGCTLNASAPVDGKAAIEMDSSLTSGIKLTITDSTATGFGSGNVSGNSLWNNKKGNNTDANNDITVIVDGETVLAPVTFVAKINGIGYTSLADALAAVKDQKDIVIDLLADATLDITAWQTLAIGGDTTETITINGNGNTLTFNKLNSDWNHVATNNDATLILNDMTITDNGKNNGPWNRYDINFGCDVQLNNVTSTKALAFKADAVLNDVTITESGDNYAIWIQANGQTVTIDGLTVESAGRGIKIDEQYVDAPAKVALSVKDATFTTAKKAAILVKSAAGADITLNNVDIAGVAADTVNAVWVDADAAQYFGLVTVTGGTKAQEDLADFTVSLSVDGKIMGYYKSLQAAIDACVVGDNTITLLADSSENVTIKQTAGISFTINGNGKTFGGTITIDGASRSNGEETLTITNVNFLAETEGQSSIITKKGSYAHNVTIDGCTFTGTDAKNAYGINLQHAYDITVKNVTGTKLYDLVYGKFAVTGFVAEDVTVTETGTGFWFTSVKNASFKNVNVKAANAIGVKNAMSSTMTFENCSFEAEIPVYMWLSAADVSYSMVFNGTNSMVATNGGSWLVIKETESAGFKVTLNDTGLDAAGIDTAVAMIGDNVYYNSVAYAVKDAQDGETVVVIADDTSAKDIIANNNVTLDLNGYDVTGNLTVNGNLTIIDSTVDEAAKNYDDAGHLNGTVTVADGATLTLYAGIYNQNVDEYCADHYLARDNKDGTWTVCRGVVFNKTYGTSFMTIADAMANAMTTAGRDHIVLLEDHFENIVIVYDNTILDLGTFDLTTNYVIVFKGGNLTGNTYSSTNDYGKLIVAQRDTNVIFDGEGYINANGYTVLPTWDADQGCYVFSYFVMTTTGVNRGYKYDVDNDTARVTFKIQTGRSAVNDLLLDGIANHGINIVLTVTCKKDGNAVTQDYFYSDELLKECFGDTDNLIFQLDNVSSLTDVTFEIKVVSETGAYQSGGVVTLAECEQ